MKTNEQIIDTIKNLKDEQSLSLSELARRVGMAKSALSSYFNGKTKFPLNRINEFAKALNTTPEYILDSDNINKNNKSCTTISTDKKIRSVISQLNKENKKNLYKYAKFKLQEQNSK